MMTSMQIAMIEKTGADNGFEYQAESDSDSVTLGSARHRSRANIGFKENQYSVSFITNSPSLLPELKRTFSTYNEDKFLASNEANLASILRRASALAQALPSQAADDYETQVTKELKKLPEEIKGTEVERIVRQRVGQDSFRKAQLDYWGNACAVTGISISEALRASHAKPWAECDSDKERLDVFNGFLLSANLDALFDKFLISFDEFGKILISKSISPEDQERLALTSSLKLRWLADEHLPYLSYHRAKFAEV